MENYTIKSPEYVLGVLDEWYYNIIKSTYTKKDEDDMIRLTLKSFEGIVSDSEMNELKSIVSKLSSVESQVEASKNCFSQGHATLEAITNGLKIKVMSIDDIPEGVRKEYLDPIFYFYDKMNKFVEYVRKKADENFPNDLNNNDINSSFLEVFKSQEEYVRFIVNMLNSSFILFDIIKEGNGNSKKPEGVSDFLGKFSKLSTNLWKDISRRFYINVENSQK
jgi:hypothetical protein